MTRRRPRRSPPIGLALCLAGLAAPAAAQPVDLLYERTLMGAADLRCGLFSPEVGAALAAARAQARGAALRAGTSEPDLAGVEQRARARAAATACASPDLATAAQRVRGAYEGYSRLSRMTYPGEVSDWRADRTSGVSVRWRLAQTTVFGWDRMIFGLAGREGVGSVMAVATFADGATPYAARLVLRDPARADRPYLNMRGADPSVLARRLPPPSALQTYAAEARSPAGRDLLAKDMGGGWAFRFPADAARALAALDPREAVAVDFVFSGPTDIVRRAYVEVGDFAAGRAFLQVATR